MAQRRWPEVSQRSAHVLLHINDAVPPPMSRPLNEAWTAISVPLRRLRSLRAGRVRDCLIDVDLSVPETARVVRAFLSDLAPGGLRLLACSRDARRAADEAAMLAATDLVTRPFSDDHIIPILSRHEERQSTTATDPVSKSVAVGALALDLGFRSLSSGTALATEQVRDFADTMAAGVAEAGIGPWLRSIRAHHAGTYQHCLIVTGLSTAFGQELGFSAADLSTLTVAAMLHDIGKGRLDVAILDKPGALTEEEFALVRMHPVYGDEHLRAQSGFSDDIRDVVRHHHEYLDGSGYPDGLSGSQISDLTRLVTVVDVFGALIEHRSYKPPMPAAKALGIVQSMAAAGKVEGALVEAFGLVVAKLVAGGDLDAGTG